MLRAGVLACLTLAGAALTADVPELSLLQRGDELESGSGDESEVAIGDELEDMIEVMAEGRPKWRKANRTRRSKDNLTASLDQIIPLLQADFKKKTDALKRTLRSFKEK
jgi:hypothetical protein